MGLNLENVPEKGHFTIAEIAERWEVDDSVVEYFIFEKGLRLAAYVRDLKTNCFLIAREKGIDADIVMELGAFTRETCDNFSPNQTSGIAPTYELINTEKEVLSKHLILPGWPYSHHELPKYIYYIYWPNSPFTPMAELFDGLVLLFLESFNHVDLDTKNISQLVFKLLKAEMFKYITKEERDRFELEYGISIETKSIQQQVSKKTENKQRRVIKALSEYALNRPLTDQPHSDAKEIDLTLSRKGIQLPCTPETLVKYLAIDSE